MHNHNFSKSRTRPESIGTECSLILTNTFNTVLALRKAICYSWSISAKASWDLAWKETAHPLIQIAVLVPYSEGISWWAGKKGRTEG